jgi:uncharacterized protein YciI
MKSFFFFLFPCLLFPASAQITSNNTDSLFIVTYTSGPAWDVSKPPTEQSFFKEHSANLGKWRKEGVIKMGARYADKGMIVIRAASLEAAKVLINNDEGVVNRLFRADVQRLSVFYDGCIERKSKE